MEANEAKKPKRPRIGQPMGLGDNQNHGPESHYENSFNANGNVENTPADGERHEGFQHDRPYQPRNNYNRPQGGYQQRPGGYNRPQGGYQPRNNYGQQGGYQPRNNYGQQGGYNNQQGGYMNNNRRPNGPGNRFQKGPIRQGKSFTPRPKRIEYELPLPDPDEKIRLNKFMANAGLCSRREADEFIQQGLVKVNGQVVTELGTKISHDDTVEYDEKVVALESKCYILLNKPKDCVTTSDDPNGRTTVLDLVKGACNERIYPVGRLDRNTTGVLLLTNDGDLASKLTHPKYVKKKIYHVWTDKDIAEEDMQRIADGIELEDGPIHADAISYATETDRNQAGIEIHSGRNRIVRRIFESLGYHVTKLDRVYFAGLTKKNLPRGRWRYLTQEEVNFLKMGSFE
jgi:23S rRNA pseudouridine2605 synthase